MGGRRLDFKRKNNSLFQRKGSNLLFRVILTRTATIVLVHDPFPFFVLIPFLLPSRVASRPFGRVRVGPLKSSVKGPLGDADPRSGLSHSSSGTFA